MDPPLEQAWGRYRTWADTSRKLKAEMTTWERRILVFTICGTFFGSFAPFAADAWPSWLGAAPMWWSSAQPAAAWLGAAFLALATYFGKQWLTASEKQAWTKARAVAEAMKSESYKYATGAPPYDDPATRADVLAEKITQSAKSMEGVIPVQVAAAAAVKGMPQPPWSLGDYVTQRLDDQVEKFYKPRITEHAAASRRARHWAMSLGALATVISVSAAAADERSLVAAVLGTITTAGAALASYFQAGRHFQLALNYQAAADQAGALKASPGARANPAKFVNDVEAVFRAEHAAWLAEWTR